MCECVHVHMNVCEPVCACGCAHTHARFSGRGFIALPLFQRPPPCSSILLPQQGTLRVPDPPSYLPMALACVLAVAASPAFLLLLPPLRGISECTSRLTSLLCSDAAVAPTSPRVRPESSRGNEAPPSPARRLPDHRPPHSPCSPCSGPSVCTAFPPGTTQLLILLASARVRGLPSHRI